MFTHVNAKNSVAYDGARQGWFAQGFNIWISPTLQSLHLAYVTYLYTIDDVNITLNNNVYYIVKPQ